VPGFANLADRPAQHRQPKLLAPKTCEREGECVWRTNAVRRRSASLAPFWPRVDGGSCAVPLDSSRSLQKAPIHYRDESVALLGQGPGEIRPLGQAHEWNDADGQVRPQHESISRLQSVVASAKPSRTTVEHLCTIYPYNVKAGSRYCLPKHMIGRPKVLPESYWRSLDR
jgi:hypothetical protein